MFSIYGEDGGHEVEMIEAVETYEECKKLFDELIPSINQENEKQSKENIPYLIYSMQIWDVSDEDEFDFLDVHEFIKD